MLSKKNLKQGLARQLYQAKSTELDDILDAINQEGDGEDAMISYSDFLAAAADKKKLLSKENLKIAFNFFDQDGNGIVTRSEMRNVLNASGRYYDDAEVWS